MLPEDLYLLALSMILRGEYGMEDIVSFTSGQLGALVSGFRGFQTILQLIKSETALNTP